MAAMLRTPGLEKLLGRSTALITVTGRRSGTRYTTPVTYHRDRDSVIVVSKRMRTWWRNLDDRPEVELRLAGSVYTGRGRALLGDPAAVSHFVTFLEHRRRDARFYGLTVGDDGRVEEDEATAILPQLVIVVVDHLRPHRAG